MNNKLTFEARIIYFLLGFLLLAIGLSTPIIYVEIIILIISIIFLANSFVGISIINNTYLSIKSKNRNPIDLKESVKSSPKSVVSKTRKLSKSSAKKIQKPVKSKSISKKPIKKK